MDLSDTNDVRTLSVLSVPAGSRVLELGGGGGPEVARALEERGCAISLVAPDERTARKLGRHCADTLVADLDAIDLLKAFDGATFDAILSIGCLPYVRSPLSLLRQVTALLAPSGRLIASLPNVAHGAVRLELLRGRFRAPGGNARSARPLHLFDGPSMRDLFEDAGLAVVEQLKVTRLLHETEAKLDPSTFSDEVLSEVAADPDSLVYEFVLIAGAGGSAPARSLPTEATLAERLQARTEELTAAGAAARSRIESLEEHAAALTQKIEELTQQSARTAGLEDRLREMEAQLAASAEDRRLLELDVAVKDAFITELRLRIAAEEQRLDELQEHLDRTKWHADVALNETRVALNEAQVSLAAEADESSRLRARASELDRLHHRLASKANRMLLRVPGVHRALRGAVSRMAARRDHAE